MKEWKKTGVKQLGGNKWKKLEIWNFTTPRDIDVEFTMTVGYNVVVVFGVTHDKKILIIEEYYPSLEKKVATLVAGVIEDKSPEDTAKAELKEETGYEAEKFINLGVKVRGKYNTGLVYYYLATNIIQVGEPELEDAEDIENKLISMDELKKLVRQDKFQDVLEMTGVYLALDYLSKNNT